MAGVCTVDCTTAPCMGAVNCPVGFDCKVECGAQQSCQNLHVQCPVAYACEVDCDAAAAQACAGLQMQCSMTGPCTLACGPGVQACSGAKIACGLKACIATCAGSSAPMLTCDNNSICPCTGC